MPHKRYKHCERHKHDQPERLINATDAVNLTSVHPKHSINNKSIVKRHKKRSAPKPHKPN